jgi:type I restriction enzyme S subunit
VLADPERDDLLWLTQVLTSPLVRAALKARASGTGAGMKNISKGAFLGIEVVRPPLGAQREIARVLRCWDECLRLVSCLIDTKIWLKQGLMQQLLTGRRRFQGFTGKWKSEELGQYLEECSSRVPATTALPIYTSSRAGLKPQEDYYGGRTIANDGEYGVVPIDCFVFRHMSDDGLFVFHINQTGGDIAVSKEYPVFRAVNLDRHFLLAKLNHSPDFKAFALSQKAGGTRTRLYFSKLRTWKTLLPSLAEQRRIAEVLNAIDREIDLLRRELEALKQQKKGLMQKLLTGEVRVKVRP